MGVRSGHAHIARLEGLAEGIQDLTLEFGKLVEKQDAEMGEADLAGAHPKPAADERGHRGAVMG